jgi:biotin carboxyl carrier protein
MDPRVHLDLTEGEVVDAHIDGVVRRVRFDDARRRDAFASTANVSDGHHAVNVVAPMPGRIIEIRVSVGDAVTRGDTVAMIEAMKMESAIIATHPGTIAAVLVERGTVVATRQPLLRIESA